MTIAQADSEALLARAAAGDATALPQLLTRCRPRLKRMVQLHLDRRLVARIDPSDVVQDTCLEASHRFDDYLDRRPVPFYPWLRGLAWDRLLNLHAAHVLAGKRTVLREQGPELLPDESAAELANRLVDPKTSASLAAQRDELRVRMQLALARLNQRDREVLVLRHLEELSVKEAAATLGITETALRSRHFRALRALHELFESLEHGN